MTRVAKAAIPINFNLDYSPGKQLLLNSKFDLRFFTYTAPDGTDLTDSPELRSMFQEELGKLNMESKFNKLAYRQDMIDSMSKMDFDMASGYRGDYTPRDYYHNQVIRSIVEENKKIAWQICLERAEVQALRQEQLTKKMSRSYKQATTTPSFQNLLAMYK